jgi:Zn-dependent protease
VSYVQNSVNLLSVNGAITIMDVSSGSFRLFRFSGIDVFLSWYWFLVAAFEIMDRSSAYSSRTWNVLEYLALFVIVLLHEFGHALACRQVGGTANRIVLWPLGGVAYVNPPQRPGATLWSIAAGPLVNVALAPVFYGLFLLGQHSGWAVTQPDVYRLLWNVLWMDIVLLAFNMLPIYPLDGGQILRSLLWFVFGRARSLMIATVLGFAGTAGLGYLAFRRQSYWLGFIAVYMLTRCVSAFQSARALSTVANSPRRYGIVCPSCKASPPVGNYWKCNRCGAQFDTFQTQAVCPGCTTQFAGTRCLDCGKVYPMPEWLGATSISSAPL